MPVKGTATECYRQTARSSRNKYRVYHGAFFPKTSKLPIHAVGCPSQSERFLLTGCMPATAAAQCLLQLAESHTTRHAGAACSD